jgi:hypothetical protein
MCFVKVSLKEDQGGPSSVPSKKCQRIFLNVPQKIQTQVSKKVCNYTKKLKWVKVSKKSSKCAKQTNGPKSSKEVPQACPN